MIETVNKQFHSCNIFESRATRKRLWHFAVNSGDVRLASELPDPPAILPHSVNKDWRALWSPRLNIAWLPADQIFLRVIQLPAADAQEMLAMLEFQLEKLSPIPVGQIVWSVEFLPNPGGKTQSAVVIIVAREVVEKFLGHLETAGYLADRLEIPLINQLGASGRNGDGAWIYANVDGMQNLCLVAWWSDKILQNIQLLHLPINGNLGQVLQEQLLNTAWAGEMEGWLKLPIRWHLVADPATAALWEPSLREFAADTLDTAPPASEVDLAQVSAGRAVRGEAAPNLLPVEFASRYRQQFIDGLWLRGLAALLVIYVVGVIGYLGLVQILSFRHSQVERKVTLLANSYTNALQLKERVQVLDDQLSLKYAALDCWRVSSELLPTDLTLTSLIFGRGGNNVQGLTLTGSAPQDQAAKLADYNEALRNATVDDQPLFSKVTLPNSTSRGGNLLTWSFQCDLTRLDIE